MGFFKSVSNAVSSAANSVGDVAAKVVAAPVDITAKGANYLTNAGAGVIGNIAGQASGILQNNPELAGLAATAFAPELGLAGGLLPKSNTTVSGSNFPMAGSGFSGPSGNFGKETNYTPWIIGGVAALVLIIGAIFFLRKK